MLVSMVSGMVSARAALAVILIPRIVRKGRAGRAALTTEEMHLISDHWTCAASPDVFAELTSMLTDA
eukprot:scaffold303922_cov42-Prasinocladus_malaysianus.AAC.1